MAKTKSHSMDDGGEEVFGATGLLDRIGKRKPVAELSSTQEKSEHEDTKEPKRQIGKRTMSRRQNARITVYMNPDDLDNLDQQVIEIRRKTGKKKDRSTLINEAVQFWLEVQ